MASCHVVDHTHLTVLILQITTKVFALMLGVDKDRFIPGFIAKNEKIIAHVRKARADYGYGGCFMSQDQVSSLP